MHASVSCNHVQVTLILLFTRSSLRACTLYAPNARAGDINLGLYVELLSLHLDSILGDETLLDIRYSDDANSACQ